MAQAMFERGALLILSARREDQLNRVAKALGDPSRVKILPLDLTGSPREMGAAVTQVSESYLSRRSPRLRSMRGGRVSRFRYAKT